jgi:hypothetical protein
VTLLDGVVVFGTGGKDTKITIADGATVTLNGVDITAIPNFESYTWAGITCLGDAVIILADGTANKVAGGMYSAGIFVPEGHTLTIHGDGSLDATGGYNSAGIGSGREGSCGDITIGEGITRITATMGMGAFTAIGQGIQSQCGTVAIAPSLIDMSAGKTRTLWPVISDFGFYDIDDNTASICKHADSKKYDIQLRGRKLYRDGTWNTLCLPFDLDDFSGTPLEGFAAMELDTETAHDGHKTGYDPTNLAYHINFKPATGIKAGKPYIVKWESGEKIENPVFNKVTINNQINNVETNDVTFCGAFNPFILEANDNTKLYMGNNNTLYYPSKERTINSFRAYFQLADGITAGNLTSGTQGIKAFVLDFDNEQTTGIIGAAINDNEEMTSDKWYTLDGRRLAGKPTQKGVYINNGSKVVIK